MYAIAFMAKIYSLQCLPSNALHEMFWNPSLVSVQLVENGAVTVLEHQVKLPLPPEDFNEVDEVGMLELSSFKAQIKGPFLRRSPLISPDWFSAPVCLAVSQKHVSFGIFQDY